MTYTLIAAMERKASDEEACDEIETAHPRDLGSRRRSMSATWKASGLFISRRSSIST